MLVPGPEARAELTPTERKAAVIAKITKYVSDMNGDRRVTIGFVGSSKVALLVKTLFNDDHSVEVIAVRSKEDAAKCEMAFVEAGSGKRWREMRQAAPWVLSIGETRSFAAEGGVLMLVPDGSGNFGLLYSKGNYAAAKEAGMKMSVRLLKIGTKID